MSFITKAIESLDTFVIRDINLDRVTSIKRKTMLSNYHIAPLFDDWRDTLTRYYLYLPFCGVVELDNVKVRDRDLSIECLVDVHTGNIKYFVMADGVIIRTDSCSCRVDFPVTSTNPLGRSAQIREGAQGVLGVANSMTSGMKGLTQGLVTTVGGAYTGNVNMAISGANNMSQSSTAMMSSINTLPQAITDIKRPDPTTWGGSYSGGVNIDDPLDFYLYTIVPNIEYDDGILANYGRPCNTWATLGSQNGYVKCDDIKLHGDIPTKYKTSLINDICNGFYKV